MRLIFSLLLTCLLLAPQLRAKVIDSTEVGFTLQHEVLIDAPTYRVYQRFVQDIGRWWNGVHSFSNHARNLVLEAKPGGCLCESWSGDKWVEHLRVVQVQPNQVLVLRGALGPLQNLAVSGSMTISFTTTEQNQTRLLWTYTVGGYAPTGLKAWAGPVDGIIGEQIQRFERYAHTGKPR
jgi:uncharacterized protein YndB with AHSA1/START domain